jgi:hypothetical protein
MRQPGDGMDDPGAGRPVPDEIAGFGSSTTWWRSPSDLDAKAADEPPADGRMIGLHARIDDRDSDVPPAASPNAA